VVRTGNRLNGRNYATPTGNYRIGSKSVKSWSKPYPVWLPHWQQFNGGIGFHATTTYLHDGSRGSHGCVNLLAGDAETLYNLTPVGTAVVVFGQRPGT
jgi:lipoprotein-anchoring transpeptidase ErfK/SrfK